MNKILSFFLCISLSFSTQNVNQSTLRTNAYLEAHCVDEASFNVNNVYELSNGTIFIIHKNYLLDIEKIRENKFPVFRQLIIRNSSEILKILETMNLFRWKSQETKTFRFIDYTYFEKVSNTNGGYQKLLGFNQVWLGCPQPLCLAPTIDTILKLENNTIIIFRGLHFWQLNMNSPPFVKYAKLIENEWRGLSAHLDACYTDRQGNYVFFKDNNVWVFRENNLIKSITLADYNTVTDQIDAAMYFIAKQPENDAIYLFKDNYYWKIERISAFNKAINFSAKVATPIDAVLPVDDVIFIFKDWMYYVIDITLFFDNKSTIIIRPQYSMSDIFNCDTDLYKDLGFGKYEHFLTHIARFSHEHSVNDWIAFDVNTSLNINYDRYEMHKNKANVLLMRINRNEPQTEMYSTVAPAYSCKTTDETWLGFYGWLIIIVLLIFIIVFVIFVFHIRMTKQEKKTDEILKNLDHSNEELTRRVNQNREKISKCQLTQKFNRTELDNINREKTQLKSDVDILKGKATNESENKKKRRCFGCCFCIIFYIFY